MSTFAAQFLKQARVMAGDLRHRQIIRTALGNYELARDQGRAAFQDWPLKPNGRRSITSTIISNSSHLSWRRVERKSTGPALVNRRGKSFCRLSAIKRRSPSSSPKR
jgi:hypothetical protein